MGKNDKHLCIMTGAKNDMHLCSSEVKYVFHVTRMPTDQFQKNIFYGEKIENKKTKIKKNKILEKKR